MSRGRSAAAHVGPEDSYACRLVLRRLFAALTRRWTNLRVVTAPDIEPNVFAGAVRRFDLAFDLR